MEESTNYKLLLWGLSVIQPATPNEVLNYLTSTLNDNGLLPEVERMVHYFELLEQHGYMHQVSRRNNLYSLTPRGNERLTPTLKRLRDKIRLFMLDNCHSISKLGMLASTDTENMDGDSPSLQLRHNSKEVPHPSLPWAAGALPSSPRQAWVRIYEQLKIGSMSSNEASTPPKRKISSLPSIGRLGFSLNYYSFNTLDDHLFNNDGVTAIASCIGISPGLLTTMIKSPKRYYRTFNLQKKSGGFRPILAPRKFIKTIQYWINDHVLNRLKIHSSCYSYRKGVSVKDNAINHVGKAFVASIDISDYFGSINTKMIKSCFYKNNIPEHVINAISGIVTYNDVLPQGAPTSPIISNAILFEFDAEMTYLALRHNSIYTRYSDDISISSDKKENIDELIRVAEANLLSVGFKLNENKRRVVSRNNRQVVTGILVNESIRPTRTYRKKIRSAFDHALKENDNNQLTINKLRGYLNYLKSFESYGFSFNEKKYKDILDFLLTLQQR
ncbi:TPA: RNA-directed DNA polymerase [Serratia marcescens]|nr:RNA-directed DNA polymerase [Serratia marcescens]HAT2873589.1 RNA-directed DNA polymerase [Serratia marcescens]HAT2924243.1 RNA-directed DNA polymerase [Serratia marcescens]